MIQEPDIDEIERCLDPPRDLLIGLARLAAGAAPDLLKTKWFATEAPIVLAPAMNHVMWAILALRANHAVLGERGVGLPGPEDGVVTAIQPVGTASITDSELLHGKTVIVTAGPTCETIRLVRHITNRSSGKMGYAIARYAGVSRENG